MEAVKAAKKALYAVSALPVLLAGCMFLERPGVQELPPEIEAPPPPSPSQTPSPMPTATPTSTRTPLPVKLPDECHRIIDDSKLTDLFKHRELFSVALELEFKGRLDEAIAVLREALKFRPDNELTRMKLAQLEREARGPEGTGGHAAPGEEPAQAAEIQEAAARLEEAPPGMNLPDAYLDIVNNARMGDCAKGYRLFVMGGDLDGEGKTAAALFVYKKAVSLCPGDDGPNATLNKQAMTRIAVLEKRAEGRKTPGTRERPGAGSE